MKITKILKATSALLMSGSVLVACAPQTGNKTNTNTGSKQNAKKEAEFKNIKESAFLLSASGEVLPNDTKLDQKEVIDWYIDPYCPSCIMLETIMEDKIETLTDKMVIRFHPLSFLSPRSVDDYSNRASAYILAIAEKQPSLTRKFMHGIMNEEFHPGSGENSEKPAEEFKKKFISIGGTEAQWKEIHGLQETLIKEVKAATAKAFNDKELTAKAASGRLTVPFVILGDSDKALDFSEAVDAESYFMTQFDKYTKDKGIKSKSEDKKAETETTTVAKDGEKAETTTAPAKTDENKSETTTAKTTASTEKSTEATTKKAE